MADACLVLEDSFGDDDVLLLEDDTTESDCLLLEAALPGISELCVPALEVQPFPAQAAGIQTVTARALEVQIGAHALQRGCEK